MTNDLHDTALPRFEDRLWAELRDAHEERRRPAVVTPHRPNRRRRPLAVGAAVAVAAATTLVIGIATLPGGEPPKAEASIEQRIIAATDAALEDSVVHVVTDFVPSSAGEDSESWYDDATTGSRTRHLTEQGALVRENGLGEVPAPNDPTRVERYVQACDETYMDTEVPYEPSLFPDMDIQDRIATGHLVVEGTEVVDGRELIRLHDDFAADLDPGFAAEQTYYVDPDTYLPVEIRSAMGTPDENVLTVEYLPRTAANLELLIPPVPAGYTEVAQLGAC
jgi:hypothetical protein